MAYNVASARVERVCFPSQPRGDRPMATQNQIVEATNQFLMPNYGRLPIAVARGDGARLWDADGKEYLDLFAGFGMGGVAGHCHPKITEAVVDQAQTLVSHGNLFTNVPQVELARQITRRGFGGKVFYAHSGAEANEAALKIARRAAGEGRYKIISFQGCFHGRTMGALSLTPAKYQASFEPMLPGGLQVPYGDAEALAAAIDDETAGIILEPIQGEGGVHVPTNAFLQQVRSLCDQHNLVMICDEVWTAPARTGKWFAYQHFDVKPDVMCLGKAIGGSLPLSACVAGPKVQDVLQPGTHGCTGGGNPLCAAAALATMELIEQEDLVAQTASRGAEIVKQIRQADLDPVKQVRGRGFMIGIELDRSAREVFSACLDRGVLINCTQDTVIRLAPPLTIEDEQLMEGLETLLEVLAEMD
jgi:predicted acetylornithine/succinylornithine family transaminase